MIFSDMPHVYRVPEWGNATLVEISWTLLGFVGLVATLIAMMRILQDRQAFYAEVERMWNPSKRRAARLLWRAHIRREAFRAFQMAIMLGIGLYAIDQPPLTRPTATTLTGMLITFAFFVWAAGTVFQSIADTHVRHELTEILDHEEGKR